MIELMNLAAVVIWYNPQKLERCIENILTYSKFIPKVFIVDNSDSDNSKLAELIPNSVYITNRKNIGIAAAQNIGCDKAKAAGFDWVITMDQDSSFDDDIFEQYIKKAENYIVEDSLSTSFSIQMQDESQKILPLSIIVKKKLKKFLVTFFGFTFPHPIEKAPIDHPDRVYASANIIKLSVWTEIGKFDESLFIDEVDFDFCIRLKLAGFKITRFNTIYLNHKLGNRKFTIFSKCSYHTGKRLFFIIRNKLIENKRYRYALKLEHDYQKEIFQYFKDYCIFDIKAPFNWLIFVKAFIAYKKFIKADPTYKNLKAKGLAK